MSSLDAARDRALLEHAAHAVVIVDDEGTVTYASPAAAALAGAEPLVADRLADHVHPDHRQLLVDAIARADGEPVEFRWEATARWAEVIVSDLRDEPSVAGAVLSLRDNSEQRRLGDQMTRAYLIEREAAARSRALEDMKAGLLAAVSHDFRTPLTIVVGFGDMLRDHGHRFSEVQRVEMLGRLVGAAEELGRRVDDFLDISRREAGVLDVHVEPCPVSEVVLAAVAHLELSLCDHDVVVDIEEDVVVQVDRMASTRVLENLLGNAAKYAPVGTSVTVRVEAVGDEAWLSVTDEGPGIAIADQARIFERFVRATADCARAPRGAGVGLAAARHLAEAQGGRVEVRSTPGAGATFTLAVPLAVSDLFDQPVPA